VRGRYAPAGQVGSHAALGAAVLAAMLGALPAAAQPRRVEVAVASDSELYARIVGQTADLAVTPAAVGDTWQTPDALRVWLVPSSEDGPQVVVVADPASGRTLRRTVGTPGTAGLSASVNAEAVALVVRSGLVELLTPPPEPEPMTTPPRRDRPARRQRPSPGTGSETASGSESDADADADADAESESEPDAESVTESESESEPEPESESEPGSGRIGVAPGLRAGMQAVFDGAVPPPELAPEIGLGVLVGRTTLALVGAYGLRLESRDATSIVGLRRHHVALDVAYALGALDAVHLALAWRAGLYVLARDTRIRDVDYRGTADATTSSALFSARARLRVPLAGDPPGGQALWLAVDVGLDLVPGAPTLTYERGTETVTRDALWLPEPVLAAALEYHLWP